MKITELRCSACDGTLKIDEQNPRFAECEYCHTRYTIEWEHPGHPGDGDAHLKKMPEKIAYQPIHTEPPKTPAWRYLVVLAACAAVIFGVSAVWLNQRQEGQKTANSPFGALAVGTAGANDISGVSAGEADDMSGVQLKGLLAAFAERVFEVPAEDISGRELAKIKWLEFSSDIDYRKIGYSFSDPLEDSSAELTWVTFSRDKYQDADLSCLPLFTGLKRVGASRQLRQEDTKGLSLNAIRGYYDSMAEAAAAVENPSQIRYLDVSGTPFSMEGIDQFPNLEILILDSDQIDEGKLLVGAGSLKTLSIDMYDGKMDFSVLGMMPWLESVSVRSESLRDLGFLSKMISLRALSVENGGFLTLSPLGECSQLEEVSVVSCRELKDMGAVSSLTNLKKLKLELPYGCAQPDLSGLTGLTELYLDGFDSTGFLRNMGQLETLTLDSCTVDSPSDFEGLVNLKTLRCTAFSSTARDYGFITRLPALEDLNLSGTATYDDISGIFNLPTLRRLNLNHMECEINFDRIGDNTTLEALSIDKIKLYKNVKVSGGGGIAYVDWDNVSLTEHLSFLAKLQGLKELSIRENELTDIGFAASLPALESIDVSDNYVTDLSPLSGLKNLSYVNCEENPISNYEVLGDSVMVVR